jgi:hypothetical protein
MRRHAAAGGRAGRRAGGRGSAHKGGVARVGDGAELRDGLDNARHLAEGWGWGLGLGAGGWGWGWGLGAERARIGLRVLSTTHAPPARDPP